MSLQQELIQWELVAERFWSKVRKTDTCWIWTASYHSDGYGQFWLNGKLTRAQRVAYELSYGPIPKGKDILHHCDNPACVNPNHLFVGTQADNNIDMKNKGRQVNGERVGSAKLTWSQVREIRAGYASGKTTRQLGKEFHINSGTISRIVNHLIWKEAPC